LLNKNKKFSTYKIVDGKYEVKEVLIEKCYVLNEEIKESLNVNAVITAVGPRNIPLIVENLKKFSVPIICFENDSSSPDLIISLTGNQNVVFAIPDVIASNTAPEELKNKDPLSLVTENGVCYIDKKAEALGGDCLYIDKEELKKQWMAKLYLHNTPHCIAAYIGSLLGVKYLHESMQSAESEKIVEGAMREMADVLIKKFNLEKEFVDWYAKKELQRFKNVLLFDPISRVAREPFRKLALNERLIGSAQLCISCGVLPENIMLGIMAAFCYDNPADPDANIKYLMESLKPEDFLKIAMRLRSGEALCELLLSKWDDNLNKLNSLK
jgi:hypothetical protein